jgi:DNA-binding NarL/FixJ family response regulator
VTLRQFVWRLGRTDNRRSGTVDARRSGLREAAWAMKPSNPPSGDHKDFGLTTGERRVIALVGAGYTDKDLAQELGISENTAKHQLSNVFDKLGVCNRFELVLFAVDQGLNIED